MAHLGAHLETLAHFGVRHTIGDRREGGTQLSPKPVGTSTSNHGKGGKGGLLPHECRGDFIISRTGQRGFRAAFCPSCTPRDSGGVTTFTAQVTSPAKPAGQMKGKVELQKELGAGESAAELIKSFEGDGELSQVHIKGQGNECQDEGSCKFKCSKLINKYS